MNDAELLRPDWSAPVDALCSTRAGGVSEGPWRSLNLGSEVGDDPAPVAENRRRFATRLGAAPVWLRQVHGNRVVRIGSADIDGPLHEADAAWSDEPGVACTVQVADCLPALFAAPAGRAVAAAHAGWRGLAAGVLEATLGALCEGAACAPGEVQVWLGPSIGPARFEVGAEVLQAFGADPAQPDPQRFTARARADGSAAWLAHLTQLARDRLVGAGVTQVSGGRWCTMGDASRFFSYRRDGVTGRFAAAVSCRRR